jgi:hypothetical protein
VNLTTNDGALVGKQCWRVTVGLADEYEPWARTVDQAEFPSGDETQARDHAATTLREQPPAGPREYWWAQVEFGEYLDTSFEDGADFVTDASWERSESVQGWHAWRTDKDEIQWGEL